MLLQICSRSFFRACSERQKSPHFAIHQPLNFAVAAKGRFDGPHRSIGNWRRKAAMGRKRLWSAHDQSSYINATSTHECMFRTKFAAERR